MKPEELKKYFENYQLATQNFNKNSIKNSLVKYFSENSVFHFCYPFGTFNGLDKLLTNCINPLLDSIPDLERRDMIVMAGTTPEGKDWLAKYAIYNFSRWMDGYCSIKSNYRNAEFRFLEIRKWSYQRELGFSRPSRCLSANRC